MAFKVNFDMSTATYSPGEDVSGTVVLQLDKAIPAGSVAIFLKGAARTFWTETRSITTRNANGDKETKQIIIPYESAISYVSNGVTVWSDGSKKKQLKAGKHKYSFRFMLPADAPPSFEGKHGKIVYAISVQIDGQWPFKTPNSQSFTVLPFVDLNSVSMATSPIRLEEEKKTGLILFRNGNVSVNVNIPKTGFVPGEVIPVLCDVDNDSSKPVVKAKVKLCRRICYEAASQGINKSLTEETVIADTKKDLSIAPKFRCQVQLELIVPPTVSLNRNRCSIINIDYYLVIKIASKSLFNSEIKLRPSVLIGTVPVVVEEPPNHQNNVYVENNNDMNDSSFVYPVYPSAPPSTFSPSAPTLPW